MIRKYIEMALKHAHYEIIEDEDPFYGEVTELQGVWASGKTLEECRERLADTIDGWILVRLSHGLSIPKIGGVRIISPKEMHVA